MIAATAEGARDAVKTASDLRSHLIDAAVGGARTVASTVAEVAASETTHVVCRTAGRIATDATRIAARRLATSYLGDFAALGESVVGHVATGWRELSGDTDRPPPDTEAASDPEAGATDAG